MKKRMNGISKVTLIVLLVALVIASVAFSTGAATSTEPVVTEGRTFTGDNAAAKTDERLELTKPLEEIPLTYEAEIKLEGSTVALSKGTIFGNFSLAKNDLFVNFEIYTKENSSYENPCPTLCYQSLNATSTKKYNSLSFTNKTMLEDENGNTNALSDHIGEWVRVAITATPYINEENGEIVANKYTFDCYINGEKAYQSIVRDDVVFTKDQLTNGQKNYVCGVGSNSASNPADFPGSIRKVALYSKALTAAQIKASYEKGITSAETKTAANKTTTGLIAHYDMSVVEDNDFEEDLSGNRYHLRKKTDEYVVQSEGRAFTHADQTNKIKTDNERLVLREKLTEFPMTYEAVIMYNSGLVNNQAKTIFGNYDKGYDTQNKSINFEMFTSNRPALCYPTTSSNSESVIFDGAKETIAALQGHFFHLAITVEQKTEKDENGTANYDFTCYVNGVAVETKNKNVAFASIEDCQVRNFVIGGNYNVGTDSKTGDKLYGNGSFLGNIRSINLYNRPLTADEIKLSSETGRMFEGQIVGYDMSDGTHIRNPHFEDDISGNGYHAYKGADVGLTFTTDDADNPYYVHNLLTEMPRTIEATVYTTEARAGAIFSNYAGVAGNNIDFEVYKEGNPAIVIMNGGTTYSIKFYNYTVPTKTWVHLAAVIQQDINGNAVYVLYANGVVVDRVALDGKYVTLDMDESQNGTRKFSIGTDHNNSAQYRYFKGRIADVAVYSEALTAAEVMSSYKNGVNKRNDSLMAYYDLKTVAGSAFIQDLSGNNHHASKNDYTAIEGGRWFNYDEERLAVVKNYEQAPLTINAEVYVPSTLKQAATIFGNYYARDYINLEIYTNGKPALVIHELPENRINNNQSGYKHSIIWDVDVRGEKWTDLTVVYDKTKTGTDKYALYVDGVKVESYSLSSDSVDINHVFELDMEWIQRAIPFTLGRNASRCFQGKIKDLALYNAPLSAEEVSQLYANGADLTSKDIMAYYNLDNPENTKTFVQDETGNGYDFVYKFFESESDEAYDYSFAFIGDTQFLVYKDINEGTTKNTKPIYDWLIKNKDEKKLEYVFGLGDISDKNLISEYKYASYLYKTLGDAGINYAAIPGNHDGQTAYINYDSVFSKDTYLKEGAVAYKEGSVANYYKKFEVGEYKYMVVVLEFGAPDAVLEWANAAVAANPDRQVIVLTHGYIDYSGNFLDEKELHSPGRNSALNSGEEIWEKFVSQHSNIIISACGHIDPYNIKQRYDVGKNGNVVNQFLIDPQALDKTWSYDTGMIAMFYFSNGGKDVRVEYVSATQSLRAQENDPDAKDIVFGKENQFSFTIDGAVASEVVTEYGTIPLINTNTELNAVVLFKNDRTFIGGYASVDKAITGLLKEDLQGSYVMLVRDNVRMSAIVALNDFDGELTIDLGGYELKIDENGNYLFDIYRNSSAAVSAKYTVKNGSITKVYGRGIACINYGTDLATSDNDIDFIYDNVTFKSISSCINENVLFATWENGWSDGFGYTMTVDTVLNNCTFDMRNSIDNAVMIPMTYKAGRAVEHNVTVNGGTILAKDGSDIERFYSADEKDAIAFEKADNYTAIALPRGAAAPDMLMNDGELEFVKVSETADEVIYRLRPIEVSGFDWTPKTSITLDSQLVLNVYIPVNSTEKFTFNDAPYENLAEIENKIVTIDGKNYYHFAVALGSAEAAKEIRLVATVAIGEDTATGTFTFSIPKYASKVIANGNATEKQLATDVLAYIRAAYNYFTEFNNADEIARVNTLIDSIIGDYNAVPVSSGATKVVAPIKSVTLNLDAKPTIRFYVSDTTVEFYANGKKLNTVTGTDETLGAYIELDVYAYALCETITYGDGSYHISSFVTGSVGTSHEALVKAFVKYTESAAAYRDSVIAAD